MACPRSVFCLMYVLIVIASLSAAKSKVTPSYNNSGVSSEAKKNANGQNVYNTYNNFVAGPNKKIETLLHEIKKELNEMRKEIKYLKENKSIGKTLRLNCKRYLELSEVLKSTKN